MIRATFSPNDPVAQAKHFAGMQQDIGPWLRDYADEIAKPAVDFTLTQIEPGSGGGYDGGPVHQH